MIREQNREMIKFAIVKPQKKCLLNDYYWFFCCRYLYRVVRICPAHCIFIYKLSIFNRLLLFFPSFRLHYTHTHNYCATHNGYLWVFIFVLWDTVSNRKHYNRPNNLKKRTWTWKCTVSKFINQLNSISNTICIRHYTIKDALGHIKLYIALFFFFKIVWYICFVCLVSVVGLMNCFSGNSSRMDFFFTSNWNN